jgi:hypothetical protein
MDVDLIANAVAKNAAAHTDCTDTPDAAIAAAAAAAISDLVDEVDTLDAALAYIDHVDGCYSGPYGTLMGTITVDRNDRMTDRVAAAIRIRDLTIRVMIRATILYASASADADAVTPGDQKVECAVCYNVCRNVTRCGHAVCKQCVENWKRVCITRGKSVSCPLCRRDL